MIFLVLNWLKSDFKVENLKLDDSFIEMRDFLEALTRVMPTAKREGFATVPDVTWNDIGALKSIRSELEWSILVSFIKYFGNFISESDSTTRSFSNLCLKSASSRSIIMGATRLW